MAPKPPSVVGPGQRWPPALASEWRCSRSELRLFIRRSAANGRPMLCVISSVNMETRLLLQAGLSFFEVAAPRRGGHQRDLGAGLISAMPGEGQTPPPPGLLPCPPPCPPPPCACAPPHPNPSPPRCVCPTRQLAEPPPTPPPTPQTPPHPGPMGWSLASVPSSPRPIQPGAMSRMRAGQNQNKPFPSASAAARD